MSFLLFYDDFILVFIGFISDYNTIHGINVKLFFGEISVSMIHLIY